MVKISEMYATAISNRITEDDLKTIKQPLTISKIRIVGKKRQGCLFEFDETTLLHKCNRTDVMHLAKKFETNDTDDFKGKKITLVPIKQANGEIAIRIKQDKENGKKK